MARNDYARGTGNQPAVAFSYRLRDSVPSRERSPRDVIRYRYGDLPLRVSSVIDGKLNSLMIHVRLAIPHRKCALGIGRHRLSPLRRRIEHPFSRLDIFATRRGNPIVSLAILMRFIAKNNINIKYL